MINCFNNITATDSEVDWDRVEAATNTSGELAPHLVSQLLAEVHRDDFSNREYGVYSRLSNKRHVSFIIYFDLCSACRAYCLGVVYFYFAILPCMSLIA